MPIPHPSHIDTTFITNIPDSIRMVGAALQGRRDTIQVITSATATHEPSAALDWLKQIIATILGGALAAWVGRAAWRYQQREQDRKKKWEFVRLLATLFTMDVDRFAFWIGELRKGNVDDHHFRHETTEMTRWFDSQIPSVMLIDDLGLRIAVIHWYRKLRVGTELENAALARLTATKEDMEVWLNSKEYKDTLEESIETMEGMRKELAALLEKLKLEAIRLRPDMRSAWRKVWHWLLRHIPRGREPEGNS